MHGISVLFKDQNVRNKLELSKAPYNTEILRILGCRFCCHIFHPCSTSCLRSSNLPMNFFFLQITFRQLCTTLAGTEVLNINLLTHCSQEPFSRLALLGDFLRKTWMEILLTTWWSRPKSPSQDVTAAASAASSNSFFLWDTNQFSLMGEHSLMTLPFAFKLFL